MNLRTIYTESDIRELKDDSAQTDYEENLFDKKRSIINPTLKAIILKVKSQVSSINTIWFVVSKRDLILSKKRSVTASNNTQRTINSYWISR